MAFVHGLVFLGFWVTMKELFSMPCQNLGWLLDVIAMFRKDFLKLFYLPVFESERFSLKVVFRKGLLAGQWRWRKLPLLHDFGGMARWGCHRQKSKRIQQKERQSKWWNKVTLIGCCHIYVDYIYTYMHKSGRLPRAHSRPTKSSVFVHQFPRISVRGHYLLKAGGGSLWITC